MSFAAPPTPVVNITVNEAPTAAAGLPAPPQPQASFQAQPQASFQAQTQASFIQPQVQASFAQPQASFQATGGVGLQGAIPMQLYQVPKQHGLFKHFHKQKVMVVR